MSTLKVNTIRHTGASSDAVTLASDGTCTAKITNRSNRRMNINGAFQVWQRSTSVSVSDGSNEDYQSADRWIFKYGSAAAGVATISRSTDVPTRKGFGYSYKVDITTANTSLANSYHVISEYRFEGQDIINSGWDYKSASSYLTTSFWFKTNKTGNPKLPLTFKIGSRYYCVEVTISDTNWNKYSVTIPGDPSAGDIANDSASGFVMLIGWSIGDDRAGTGETWTSTATYRTSNGANFFDSTSNDMYLTGVQIEVGDVATDFEHRSYGDELARCQRYYYQETYTDNYHQVRYSFVASSTQQAINFDLPVPMRTAPTVTNNGNGNFRLNDYANDETCNGMTTSYPNTHMVILKFTKATGNMTGGKTGVISTEGNNDAALYFSAEL